MRPSPTRSIIAIPSAPGSDTGKRRAACRERGDPGAHAAHRLRAAARPGRPAAARSPSSCARCRSRTCSAASRSTSSSTRVGAYLTRQDVLVTGAGGSIGSELCRQIARVAPALPGAASTTPRTTCSRSRASSIEERHVPPAVIARARRLQGGRRGCRRCFAEHSPAVVFHAAAYKHVGLMEANPLEAVRNNALATRLVAMLAGELGVERFVLISTDKAVAPATVMGASKALAEWRGGRDRGPSRHPLRGACASATCSAPRAAWCRSSGARSSAAGR